MKATVFKDWYKTAAAENIETSDLFNCAGFFWLDLTDARHGMTRTRKGARSSPAAKAAGLGT